ncbi:MAG: response regulator transcription factor [Acidobacteriota bacterium]|nr:response regulator transcription factor [Acidobacteriota bacterium]
MTAAVLDERPASATGTTRILLVDDHPVVRQGIRQILTEALTPAQVDESDDGESALVRLAGSEYDAVILDITLPGRSGLEILRDIRHRWPDLPVLVLSMHPAEQFARRVLDAGAAGYLTKDSAPAQLVKAIRLVLSGRRYLSPDLIEELVVGERTTRPARPHEALSDREYQVLRMIASGKTVSQIAAALSLSVKTVSTYRVRVLEKMGMHSTAELMRYAIENRLVD